MKKFISVTNCRKENPALLIMDNHVNDIDIDFLKLAKDNGVVLLILPSHNTICSH